MIDRFYDLERLARPPRSVSTNLALHLLSSGCLVQFGALWVCFLHFMFFLCGGFEALGGTRALWGQTATTTCQILETEEWNLEINERSVYAIYYRYKVDGTDYEQRAFRTGYASTGNQVVYATSDPAVAYLKGARRNPFPFGGTVLFFGIGLGLMLPGLLGGLKGIKLLRNGVIGKAKLASKEPTNTYINEERVYAYTFEFEADGRPQQLVVKTHEGDEITDEEFEPVFFLPHAPEKAVLLDHLPAKPILTAQGHFDVRAGLPFGSCLFPSLALLGFAVMLFQIMI